MSEINPSIGISFSVTGSEKAKKEIERVTKSIEKQKEVEQSASKQQDTADKKTAKVAKKQLSAAEELSRGINKRLTALAKNFFSLYMVYKTLGTINSVSRMGQDIYYLASAADIARGKLERMGNAARIKGGSFGATAGTLRSLTVGLQNMQFEDGGSITEAAIKYGLEIIDKNGKLYTAAQLMESIARKMGELNDGQKTHLASILGLDDGTFRLVKDGFNAYKNNLKNAPTTPDTLKNAMAKYQEELTKLKITLEKLLAEGLLPLLPLLTRLCDFLTNFLPTVALSAQEGYSATPFGAALNSAAEARGAGFNEAGKFINKGKFVKGLMKSATHLVMPVNSNLGNWIRNLPINNNVNINQTFNGEASPFDVKAAAINGLYESGLTDKNYIVNSLISGER